MNTVTDKDYFKDIQIAINKSQHCQRNWNLGKVIPQEHLDLLVTAVTKCPSKQNIAFYRVHFVTDRDLIEKIHAQTDGFTVTYDPPVNTTNSQVLANLLVVFEEAELNLNLPQDRLRNTQTKSFYEKDSGFTAARRDLEKDLNTAVGVAAGYLNLSASLLGYETGCCSCFNAPGVQQILNLDKEPVLLMGIGYKNEDEHRRRHHIDKTFVFPTKPKQAIQVVMHEGSKP